MNNNRKNSPEPKLKKSRKNKVNLDDNNCKKDCVKICRKLKIDIKDDNIQKNRVIDRNLPLNKRPNTTLRSQEKDRKIYNKNNLNTKEKVKNSKLNKNKNNRELSPLANFRREEKQKDKFENHANLKKADKFINKSVIHNPTNEDINNSINNNHYINSNNINNINNNNIDNNHYINSISNNNNKNNLDNNVNNNKNCENGISNKPQVIFYYENSITAMQVNPCDKMGKIIEDFTNKININKKDIYVIYNGNKINEDLTYYQTANGIDKKMNQINVLVNKFINDESKNKIIISKECICPQCYDKILLTFEDYKINYECTNNHSKKFMNLNEYESLEKIDLAKIICGNCKEKNKHNCYGQEFYFCFNCKINLCPLCKLKHEEKHRIVKYDEKNYICEKHKENFILYCQECKKNLCFQCDTELGHRLEQNKFSLQDKIIEKPKLLKEFNESEKLIGDIKKFIEEIIFKLNNFMKNLDIFYKVSKNFIDNYDISKRNYEYLQNIEEIKKFNCKICKDLKLINFKNHVSDKISGILDIYEKMSIKVEEIIYPNGDKYIGEIKDNLRNGFGKIYFNEKIHQNSLSYEGYWKNDLFDGKGIFNYKNKDTYSGEWKNGKKDGKGTYWYNNGNIYDGEWKEDKKVGKGIYTYSNFNKYEGDFYNDLIEGKGIYHYSNGNKFIGEFKNNKFDGKGVLFNDKGEIELANYSQGIRVGKYVILKNDGKLETKKESNK